MLRTRWIWPLLLIPTPMLGSTSPWQPDPVQLLADVRTLSSDDMQGRLAGSAGGAKARAYLQRRFAEEGLRGFSSDYLQAFAFFSSRRAQQFDHCANVIGYQPGSSSAMIVITAHYDHLGEGSGAIYNGADDNASGVAVLLALARYFKANPPVHTLVFAALDAEEQGLKGAEHLLEHPPFDLTRVRLNVNLDMLSVSDAQQMYAVGTHHFPQFKPVLAFVAGLPGITLKLGHDAPGTGREDWSQASDHAVFLYKRIPFVYFGVEDHARYHTPEDSFEYIQPQFFQGAATVVLRAVIALDGWL